MSDARFPRGDGPLVSVLISTRGRPEELIETVKYLYGTATDPKNVEILLKIDDDDTATEEAALYMARSVAIKVYKAPRGRGYLDIPKWSYTLAQHAAGDWLLLFNDDVRMVTMAWDEGLEKCDPTPIWHGVSDIALTCPYTEGKPAHTEFIFVRKKVIEVLGHWSLSPQIDNWLWTVLNSIGSAFRIPMLVRHKHEQMQDQTRADLLEAMRGEDFNTPKRIRQRLADAEKLLSYIEDVRHERRS